MRKWIDLFEYEADIARGYPAFKELWLDFVEPDMGEELPDEATYRKWAFELMEDIKAEPLYRGMIANPAFLDGDAPLGVFWANDRSSALSFSQSGGSPYDERFAHIPWDEKKRAAGARSIIIEIAPVTIDAVEVIETLAAHFTNGESEVRLKPHQPVKITRLWIDGEETPHACVGTVRLT